MFFKEQFPVVFMETKLHVITGESSVHLQPCCGRFSVFILRTYDTALRISSHVSDNKKAGILIQNSVFFVPKTNLNKSRALSQDTTEN